MCSIFSSSCHLYSNAQTAEHPLAHRPYLLHRQTYPLWPVLIPSQIHFPSGHPLPSLERLKTSQSGINYIPHIDH